MQEKQEWVGGNPQNLDVRAQAICQHTSHQKAWAPFHVMQ
jgi:hypothetical protein